MLNSFGVFAAATCLSIGIMAPCIADSNASAHLKEKLPKTVVLQNAISGAESSRRETSSGDMTADAIRETAGTEIALVPSEEISDAFLSGGVVKLSAFNTILRYSGDSGDTIATMNLTGSQILKLCERSVSRFPLAYDGFLQVSGMEIRFNSVLPRGARVTQIKIDGNDIKPDTEYSVATTHAMAAGAYGYFSILKNTQVTNLSDDTLAAALNQYLRTHAVIDGSLGTRVTAQ